MADGSTGNNKVYFPWEENFLVRLREAGHSWDEIHVRFNKAVPENRQRSKAGVKSKYYDLILEKSSTGNEDEAHNDPQTDSESDEGSESEPKNDPDSYKGEDKPTEQNNYIQTPLNGLECNWSGPMPLDNQYTLEGYNGSIDNYGILGSSQQYMLTGNQYILEGHGPINNWGTVDNSQHHIPLSNQNTLEGYDGSINNYGIIDNSQHHIPLDNQCILEGHDGSISNYGIIDNSQHHNLVSNQYTLEGYDGSINNYGIIYNSQHYIPDNQCILERHDGSINNWGVFNDLQTQGNENIQYTAEELAQIEAAGIPDTIE
ncbi:hypothetical protein TMEN_6618 [Trichophyton mentagrophytes]|nr:hypothetical protein TMEN_6618 [Trichophyton mentagrophytes]